MKEEYEFDQMKDKQFICSPRASIAEDSITDEKEKEPIKNWKSLSWSCHYCNQSIPEYETFKSHLKSLHQINDIQSAIYQCIDCRELSFSYASLLNHIRSIHHENLKLCCDICDEIFADYKQLSTHRDRHIGTSNNIYPIVYHCTLCYKVHSTEKDFKNHIQTLHHLTNPEESNQNLEENCIVKQNGKYQSVENIDDNQYFDEINQCKDEHDDTQQIFQCGQCSQSFLNEPDFQTHLKIHDKNLSHQCELCSKNFPFKSKLLEHMRIHTNSKNMEDENKRKKYERTTPGQLRFYICFVKKHPQMVSGKHFPKSKKILDNLWKELANGLNSMRGPSRDHIKWKESLQIWRNQLRCRARKHKAHMLATGGSSAVSGISEFEEMALSILDAEAGQGINTAETMCFEEISSIADSNTTAVEYVDEEFVEGSVINVENNEISQQTIKDKNTTPESHPKKKRRLETMYEKILDSIETRNCNENRTSEGIALMVAAIEKMASSVEKLADSVNVLAKNLQK